MSAQVISLHPYDPPYVWLEEDNPDLAEAIFSKRLAFHSQPYPGMEFPTRTGFFFGKPEGEVAPYQCVGQNEYQGLILSLEEPIIINCPRQRGRTRYFVVEVIMLFNEGVPVMWRAWRFRDPNFRRFSIVS